MRPTHLLRRGCYYSWRRRSGGRVVQIALGTKDPRLARRLSALLTAESERWWDLMTRHMMSIDDVMTALRAVLEGQPNPVASALVQAVIAQEPPPADVNVDPSITAVTARLVANLQKSESVNEKTAEQILKTAALIVEATGVSDVRRLRQHHIIALIDLLDALPPSYRKSEKERDVPLREIAAAAASAGKTVGLSVGTINRVLATCGQIIARAKSEGLKPDADLAPTALRRKTKKKSRDERLSFTNDQLRRIFSAPVWQGCRRGTLRREPGKEIIKDALYWIPLIGAYTGARREEIAALRTDDIREIDGVTCFAIEENEDRGVKTESSTRTVPVHPHLIELGLLEHGRPGERLFPDLRRKSLKSPLGASIDYMWRKVLEDQLRPEELERRCFHSLRHSMIDRLEKIESVRDRTVKGVVGHTSSDMTTGRYGSDASPQAMLLAIEQIPRVF